MTRRIRLVFFYLQSALRRYLAVNGYDIGDRIILNIIAVARNFYLFFFSVGKGTRLPSYLYYSHYIVEFFYFSSVC